MCNPFLLTSSFIPFFNPQQEASSDVVRHGGCLGVGLAAMGTANSIVYEQLKYNLFQDEAITGNCLLLR